MKNRRIISLVLSFAMLTGFAACGKKQETPGMTPGDMTETAAEETTETVQDESGTEEETETDKSTETADASETGAAETDADTSETTGAATGTTAVQNATEAQTDAPTNANTEPPATEKATEPPTEPPAQNNAPEMSFTFGNGTVNIGENAQGFTAAVPFNSEEKSPSCMGNGEDINYYYNDFTLYVWNDNGSYQTVGIDISGAGASTSRGITIGSSAEAVTAAYGTGYTEENSDFVYRYDGDCSLRFTMNNGVVTFISYNKDIQ